MGQWGGGLKPAATLPALALGQSGEVGNERGVTPPSRSLPSYNRAHLTVLSSSQLNQQHLMTLLKHAVREAFTAQSKGEHKAAGVMYIIIGFFLTPMLIGIPILAYGIYKVSR